MSEPNHNIRVVSKRTGLSPHVIRVWERRYGAVEPLRTSTNRRLYSENEVEKLGLLRLVTLAGHNIGNIARLGVDDLKGLLSKSGPETQHSESHSAPGQGGDQVDTLEARAQRIVARCLAASKRLDSKTLESALAQGSCELGCQGLLVKIIAPFAQALGEQWQRGELTAAHEHFASALIRHFLGVTARQYSVPDSAPGLIVATPTGQLHELGAIMASAAGGSLGWRVTYLGVGLPASEIAGVAAQNRARAVALSVVYPTDDPALEQELEMLREQLPGGTALLVGGRAANSYRRVLDRIGAVVVTDLEDLFRQLDRLRL